MKLINNLFQFSKFADKLNRAKSVITQESSDIVNRHPPQVQQQHRDLPIDLNAIVRNTGLTTIYRDQPENDTINMNEITKFDPTFHRSRQGEKLRFKVSGEESQVAIVDIYPGEKVRSESDKIIFMSEGVQMHTHTGGGASSMFKRFMGGSSLFVTDYTYEEASGYGRVAFAESFPSKIIPIRLDDYGGVIQCKKGSYICGSNEVEIAIAFSKKFSTGFFGGEGFILQSLTQQTPGQTVLLRAGGSIIKRTLRAGEKLKVSPGLVVAFEQSVHYDMEMISMNKGLLNIFGGARSLFQATFIGPGDLYLQTISFEHLIEEIVSRIPSRSGGSIIPFGTRGGEGDQDNDKEET